MSKQENIRQLSNSSSPKKKKNFLYQTNEHYLGTNLGPYHLKQSQVLASGSKGSQDSNSKSSAASTSNYIQSTANHQNKNHLAKKLMLNPSSSNTHLAVGMIKLQQSPTNQINSEKMLNLIGKYKNKVSIKNKKDNDLVGKSLQFSSTQNLIGLKNIKIKAGDKEIQNNSIGVQNEKNLNQPKHLNEFLISKFQSKNQKEQMSTESQSKNQQMNLQNIIKQLHSKASQDPAKDNSPQSSMRDRMKQSDKMIKIKKIYNQELEIRNQNTRLSKLEEERVRSLSPKHQQLQKQLIENQKFLMQMSSKENLQVFKQNQSHNTPKTMSRQRSQNVLQKYTSDNIKPLPIKSNFSQLLNQFSNAQKSQRLSKINSQRGNKQKLQFQTANDIQFDSNNFILPQQSLYLQSAKVPEKRLVANFKVGRKSSLSKKEQQTFSNSKKQSLSIKKKNKSSSQHRNVQSFKEEHILPDQEHSENLKKNCENLEKADVAIDVQHSFVKDKREIINKNVRQYSNVLNHIIENSENRDIENQDSSQEFTNLVQRIFQDQQLFEDKTQGKVKELFQECFNFQNVQIQKLQSQKQTQQNISPSAYEILKTDNEALSKELQTTIEKLKLTKDFAQNYKKERDQQKIKTENLEHMLEVYKEAVEKEMEGWYSEQDVKKFGRELNVLYEQNQELHKLNKRMKLELKLATEREKQFIKIIKKSPELVNLLDMEDSSFLEEQVQKKNPQEQEKAIVSSKLVQINKLDLNQVKDIQELQAQGLLPPIEDSQIIDKQQIRKDVQNLLMQENSNLDDSQDDNYNSSNSYGIEEASSLYQYPLQDGNQSNNNQSDSFNDRENQQ